jgi:hypothetical protein
VQKIQHHQNRHFLGVCGYAFRHHAVIARNGEHACRTGLKGGFSLDAIELSGQTAGGLGQGVETGRIDRDDGMAVLTGRMVSKL